MLIECLFLALSLVMFSALTAVYLIVDGPGTPLLVFILISCFLYAPFWIQRHYREFVSNAVTIRWNHKWIEFNAASGDSRQIPWSDVAKVDFIRNILVTNDDELIRLLMFAHHAKNFGIAWRILRSSSVPVEVREALRASKVSSKMPRPVKVFMCVTLGLLLAIWVMEFAQVIAKPVSVAGFISVCLSMILFFHFSGFKPRVQFEVAVNREAPPNE